jgi:hypothetical protein
VTAILRTQWLVAACVLLIAASQAIGAASAPSVPVAQAGSVLGHAGFAYIGVFRTYAAAVLWNRLDPVFHEYYRGKPIRKQRYVLPTIYMVQALDPQLEQPYYLGAYMLAENGDFKAGLALARRGVENNPKSGLLRASLVQILMLQDSKANMAEMKRQAAVGMGKGMYWSSPDDLYEALAIYRSMYRKAGDVAMADKIREAMSKLSAQIDIGDHDHNGDGKQDH